MRRVFGLVLTGLGLALWAVGCGGGGGESGGGSESAAPSGATSQASGEHGEHSGHEHGESQEDPLASLSPEDRALVEKQGTCPVSGEELGSMGTPIKVEHEGKVVFLCCDHCKGKFDEDPAKYVAAVHGGSEGGEEKSE